MFFKQIYQRLIKNDTTFASSTVWSVTIPRKKYQQTVLLGNLKLEWPII